MSYALRYLSTAEQAEAKAKATKATAPVVDESLLRAWEADLVAHRALLVGKRGADRQVHDDAIAALEAALTAAPAPAPAPAPRPEAGAAVRA